MNDSTPTNEANLSFFAYFPSLKFRTISKMCVPDQTLNMLIQLPSGCDTYALSSIAESFYVDLDDNPRPSSKRARMTVTTRFFPSIIQAMVSSPSRRHEFEVIYRPA